MCLCVLVTRGTPNDLRHRQCRCLFRDNNRSLGRNARKFGASEPVGPLDHSVCRVLRVPNFRSPYGLSRRGPAADRSTSPISARRVLLRTFLVLGAPNFFAIRSFFGIGTRLVWFCPLWHLRRLAFDRNRGVVRVSHLRRTHSHHTATQTVYPGLRAAVPGSNTKLFLGLRTASRLLHPTRSLSCFLFSFLATYFQFVL